MIPAPALLLSRRTYNHQANQAVDGKRKVIGLLFLTESLKHHLWSQWYDPTAEGEGPSPLKHRLWSHWYDLTAEGEGPSPLEHRLWGYWYDLTAEGEGPSPEGGGGGGTRGVVVSAPTFLACHQC